MNTKSFTKRRNLIRSIAVLFVGGGFLAASLAPEAHAQRYWDGNDNAAGFGVASGTWAVPTAGTATAGWSTSAAGTDVVDSTSYTTLTTDALNFGNSATGLGAGTIAVAGTVASGNMTFASGSGAIEISGGTINLAAAPTITVNNATNTIGSNLTGAATSLTKAGTGTLVLSGANTYTGPTNVSAGTVSVTGSITGKIFVNGSTAGANAAMVFNAPSQTSTFTSTGFADNRVGYGGFGSLAVTAGTVNVNGTTGGNTGLSVGSGGNSTGLITVNGGTLNIQNWLLMGRNGSTNSATLTISSGQVNVGYLGGFTSNSNVGTLYLSDATASNTSNVNLDGGTLAVFNIFSGNAGSRFNFNGGTLKALGNNAEFFDSTVNTPLVVKAGGAIIDSNTFNIRVTKVLTHDATLGATLDGGLTKNGLGTLTLTNVGSNFTGNVNITGGTLLLGAGVNATNPITSPLGNPQTAGRTITVGTGATLTFGGSNTFGAAASTPVVKLIVNGGTINNGGGFFNTLGAVDLNGGTINSVGGALPDFPSFQLGGTITVGGSAASTISSSGAAANKQMTLGIAAATNTSTTFNVADATGSSASDLNVSAVLQNSNAAINGLIKSGVGTMTLTGVNTYTGVTTISAGMLVVNGSTTSNTDVQLNATLGGSGTIGGNVSINGGTLSPGNSIDSLDTGTLSFSGGIFAAEIDTTALTADLVNVTGDLNIAGSPTLSLTDFDANPSPLTLGTVFTLVDYSGAWDLGTFSGFADNSLFTLGANSYQIDYNDPNFGGSALTLTVAAIPEPSTLVLGGLAMLGVAGFRLRRHRQQA